ncbi:MAG: hypothetical protein AB3N33_10715 [Puniceicoccaceae bacterium]
MTEQLHRQVRLLQRPGNGNRHGYFFNRGQAGVGDDSMTGKFLPSVERIRFSSQ